MRETRLYVKCPCGRDDVQIADTELACEKRLEQRGWTVLSPQKCPTCKTKPVETKGELE